MWTAALSAPILAASVVVPAASSRAAGSDAALSGDQVDYNVLVADGAALASAEAAVRAAGGTVTRTNAAVGLLTVRAPSGGFSARVSGMPVLAGVGRAAALDRVTAPTHTPRSRDDVEKEGAAATKSKGASPAAPAQGPGLDPLDTQLWGLASVRGDLARTVQAGDRRVRVGVIDTGIDGTHPDIAPNFDAALSRNFVKDIPVDENGNVVDGPCEYRGCIDPVDHDDDGHGTHVAGIIAAAANGLGVSGIAPKVTLVNIRAGQDYGLFFLQPTVDALTYAGDAGIDVVNMSFYVDPWLHNCESNPADSPEDQAEQRVIVRAMHRALRYAHNHGVTLISALGNEHENLGAPLPDASSPDYPLNSARTRTIDPPTCTVEPTEDPLVISVASYGPSRAKADYSDYGQSNAVSAPGGYFRDYFGTPWYRTVQNEILSTYPKNVGVAEGTIDAAGAITPAGVTAGVQKDCRADVCGYYQFLQGTSMASPHATGVAALIISQYGTRSRDGLTMSPDAVKRVLQGTAFDIPCPTPRTVSYENVGRDASYTATCTGTPAFNGFYGAGSVDAYAAVTQGKRYLNR